MLFQIAHNFFEFHKMWHPLKSLNSPQMKYNLQIQLCFTEQNGQFEITIILVIKRYSYKGQSKK